ncbi:plasmid partitioning protein RepB C-terminal domain-containing protein [Asticcacaulis solisilvae]|uniref:plasmid partitioning protein RepB C-terminal domain-containing protein n=1 Tax=Asticcacaulis solisilvae TaxID=1217274 RepID=UPI003FD83A85
MGRRPKEEPSIRGNINPGFELETVVIALDNIIPTKVTPAKVLKSHKFTQIIASIRAVGIIEPPAVSRSPDSKETYFLQDGHLRLLALKEIGATEVLCLISLDDEGFTYNKHFNRLSPIQENKMIQRAVERGVSEEMLAAALSTNVKRIMERRNMLDGICSEAIELLKDKMVAPKTFPVLRRMKPLRQVEAAMLMNDAGVYTKPYAMALLAATPKAQLEHPERPRKIKGLDENQMGRMEAEMESLQREYRLIEDNYGTDVLNLTLAKGYLGSLLNNAMVVRYLAHGHPEILSEFHQIAEIVALPVN